MEPRDDRSGSRPQGGATRASGWGALAWLAAAVAAASLGAVLLVSDVGVRPAPSPVFAASAPR